MDRDLDMDLRIAARLLGVDLAASPEEIKAAFRRLAKAAHPDSADTAPAVDVGRLAAAKDLLLPGAAARAAQAAQAVAIRAAQARLAKAHADRIIDLAAEERRAAAAAQEAERVAAARARVEAMRSSRPYDRNDFVDAVWSRSKIAARNNSGGGINRFLRASDLNSVFERVG